MFFVIPIPRFGKRHAKSRANPAALYLLGAVVLVMSGLCYWMLSDSGTSCGNQTAQAGQVCRYEDGSTKTYEQLHHEDQQIALVVGLVGLVAGAGCIGLGMHRSREREAKALELATIRSTIEQARLEGRRPGPPRPPLEVHHPAGAVTPPAPTAPVPASQMTTTLLGPLPEPPTRGPSAGGYADIADLFPPLPPDDDPLARWS